MSSPSEIQPHKHKHELDKSSEPLIFQCNACQEPGAGARYECQPCNFYLHEACAVVEQSMSHRLIKGSEFKLRPEAPGPDEDARLCDACGGKVLGMYYHCEKTGNDLHPCCAMLPMELQQEELTFELREEVKHRCTMCKEMDGYMKFWFYRSTCKDDPVYLHVKCVKKMALHGWDQARSLPQRINTTGGVDVAGPSADHDGSLQLAQGAARALKKYKGEKGTGSAKFERICKMVAVVVRIIVAAIVGDPTVLIIAGVSAFFSNV